MKLFLCSHFSSVGSLIKEEIENKKVAFIPTASLREDEEVMIMSRNIKGGFLTLSGVVGIVGMIIAAMQNPATAWVTPPGRMIVSILENGLLIPTVLFLVLFIYGLYILLTEKND